MAPKSFKPPRPSTSNTSSTSSSKPRAKPSKPKTNPTTISKSGRDSDRISAAARISLSTLGELSSDSDDPQIQEEEEDESDTFGDISTVSTSRHKHEERGRGKGKGKGRESVDVDMEDEDEELELELELEERKEEIPPDLMNVILHRFFQKEGTRLGREASRAVGRYMDVFVREAIARAAYVGSEEGRGEGAMLEVEDLEKLAPQLLLDF